MKKTYINGASLVHFILFQLKYEGNKNGNSGNYAILGYLLLFILIILSLPFLELLFRIIRRGPKNVKKRMFYQKIETNLKFGVKLCSNPIQKNNFCLTDAVQ